MPKSAQRQFLVKVGGIEGYWMTKSGGNISADTNKVYDGGAIAPDVLAGPAEADNVTVSRAYDLNRDAPILKKIRNQVGRYKTTISITPTDADLIAIADPQVYPDAILVGITEPETDSASGDAATYELEFAIGAFV